VKERLKKDGVAPEGTTQTKKALKTDKSVYEHIKPSPTEKILRKTTTIEVIERPIQPRFVDHRTSLSRIPRIISYLRQFYQDQQQVPHDDVVYAIEESCGSDPRTIRKHIRLLIRHGYLTPVSRKRSAIVEDKKFVSIRTKSGRTTREYIVDAGFKNYFFGPRAARSYQKTLNPPTPPTRIDEEYDSEKMCVSRRGFKTNNGISEFVGKAPVGAIDREKKEEEYVLHTHISCKNNAKTQQETSQVSHEQLNPLERAALRISKEGDSK